MTLRALAWFETLRLLRHPLILGGVAVSIAMIVFYADSNGQRGRSC
jgi:hypothetical protein